MMYKWILQAILEYFGQLVSTEKFILGLHCFSTRYAQLEETLAQAKPYESKLSPLRCTRMARIFYIKPPFPFLKHLFPIPQPQHTYSLDLPRFPYRHLFTRSVVWTTIMVSSFPCSLTPRCL